MTIDQPDGAEVQIVACPPCIVCHIGAQITMPKAAYNQWRDGAHIQRAWPEGTPGEREVLISGTHPDCFDRLFPPEDD